MILYTVKPGDTVQKIAESTGISVERILIINEIMPERLSVGQSLILDNPQLVHTVQSGETLRSIAERYGITLRKLWRNNPNLNGLADIYVGQSLVIAYENESRTVYREDSRERFTATGYVYPFVEKSVLRRTLPYLTYLDIFSYGLRSDGSLIPTDDGEMLRLSREYGTKPILVLTSLGDDGRFSTETVSRVLNSPTAKAALTENLIRVMNEKNYDGINSDFEYIAASDREAYVSFIAELTQAAAQFGKIVTVSLAPKTSSDQPGLLYEGMDYPALGKAAELSFLMTYEWGYTYSEPRAVAPIQPVEAVSDYALSVIPREKIMLGMPNYGYDWNLPWVKGVPAMTVSNQTAVSLAGMTGAEIFYNETAESPYFRYYDNLGGLHEVWFEDARSVFAKLSLVSAKNINHVGIWNMTRYFPQLCFFLNRYLPDNG